MSDKKPNVFPNQERIKNANETGEFISEQLESEDNLANPQVSTAENAAVEEMARRTAEQMKLRDESLARNKIDSDKLYERRDELMSQTKESLNPPTTPPIVPPVVNNYAGTNNVGGPKYDPFIESISQPQMNQPYDIIPLPSGGKVYPGRKPSVKVAYLTTADENILTSPNLVESGQFLEILINRKLLEPGLRYRDLIPGDRNAIMIWLRATGYGEKYPVLMTDTDGTEFESEVNLSELKTISLNLDPDSDGLYSFELPLSKHIIRFKLLTVGDIEDLESIVDELKKGVINEEQTLILEKQIVSVDNSTDKTFIKNFVNSMRVLDAQKLRDYISTINCDVDLTITVGTPGGGSLTTFLPFTPRFFWPNSSV
tara:strand:+ start:8991 stop:10103 length:1113 start_codon:yes stop_codon:yes gene_type:complete